MNGKRYDIVCKEARRRIKGIEPLLKIVDDDNHLHDSVVEKFNFDAGAETLIVEIGDIWGGENVVAARFRFIFRGYMEFEFNYDTGNSFTQIMSIYSEHRGDLLTVEFNSLHLQVSCSDIEVEEYPYTEEELKRFG